MTLDELIEKLTDLRDADGVPGDTDVTIQYQPNYPLKSKVSGISTAKKCAEYDLDEDEEEGDRREPDDQSLEESLAEVTEEVYIVACNGNEYGDKTAWATCND